MYSYSHINITDKGARIQVLDLPGIIEGAAGGRGRGRQVISTARTCNLILIVLDSAKVTYIYPRSSCDFKSYCLLMLFFSSVLLFNAVTARYYSLSLLRIKKSLNRNCSVSVSALIKALLKLNWSRKRRAVSVIRKPFHKQRE